MVEMNSISLWPDCFLFPPPTKITGAEVRCPPWTSLEAPLPTTFHFSLRTPYPDLLSPLINKPILLHFIITVITVYRFILSLDFLEQG